MTTEATTWAGFGYAGKLDELAPFGIRLAMEEDDFEGALERELESFGTGVEGALGGDLCYDENPLWAVYVAGSVESPPTGTYAVLPTPSEAELEALALAADKLGLPGAPSWFVMSDLA